MAQTYTLDEASQRLGMPIEEFKRRLKTEWTSIRSFRDGATLRFRAADIDELARTLGQASDPALVLGPVGGEGSSEESLIPPDLGSSEDDLFALPTGDSGKSKKRPKKPGDSDARLELDSGPKPGSDPDLSIQTDEFALDFSGPKSGGNKSAASSAKLTAPKSSTKLNKPQSSGKLSRPKGPDSATRIPGPPASEPPQGDSSSEFELSLDPDSDSFELQLNDSSEEVPLGGPAATGPGASGINLGRPADSGVSLEKKKPPVDRDDSDDFELSLEPDSPVEQPARPSHKLAAKKSDSDSEFELSLDDNSSIADIAMDDGADESGEKGDIFETDFELPAVAESDSDSGSEVVAVDSSDTDLENSDFDIALDESDIQADDESGSQVVLLDDSDSAEVAVDEEEAPQPVASRGPQRKRVQLEEPEEEADEEDAGEALAGVGRRRGRDDDEVEARPAKPAVWGPLPAAVLAPTLLFTFLGAIMAFDLLRGMWAYQHGRSASGGIAREIAGALDMVPQAK